MLLLESIFSDYCLQQWIIFYILEVYRKKIMDKENWFLVTGDTGERISFKNIETTLCIIFWIFRFSYDGQYEHHILHALTYIDIKELWVWY